MHCDDDLVDLELVRAADDGAVGEVCGLVDPAKGVSRSQADKGGAKYLARPALTASTGLAMLSMLDAKIGEIVGPTRASTGRRRRRSGRRSRQRVWCRMSNARSRHDKRKA